MIIKLKKKNKYLEHNVVYGPGLVIIRHIKMTVSHLLCSTHLINYNCSQQLLTHISQVAKCHVSLNKHRLGKEFALKSRNCIEINIHVDITELSLNKHVDNVRCCFDIKNMWVSTAPVRPGPPWPASACLSLSRPSTACLLLLLQDTTLHIRSLLTQFMADSCWIFPFLSS